MRLKVARQKSCSWNSHQDSWSHMRQAMANDVAAPSKSGHRRRKRLTETKRVKQVE
ncbi:hypothetical protein OH492_04400 [Vibrio chagasii]|nr:hypothetical protein [Vibrio chagasii]